MPIHPLGCHRLFTFAKRFAVKVSLLCVWMLFITCFLQAQLPFTQSNLPIIVLNTGGESIPDEPKIPALMGIIYHEDGTVNSLGDPFNDYNGLVGIERRGSTSQELSSKTPYAVELWSAIDTDTSLSLLGLPDESDWVLLAPFSDKTMMRDALAYLWAGRMMDWAPRVKFVELVLNSEYKGVYILTEKIKRDQARVDINKLTPDEISGEDLTGGYILKLDKCTGGGCDGFYSPYPVEGTDDHFPFFLYHYPQPEDIQPEQKQYIAQWMAAFEAMLASSDWEDPLQGYTQWMDPLTFADFLLVNELTKNVDAYRLSTFMYKDSDSEDGRLKMGPVWDFNIALGNADYCNAASPEGWALHFNLACPGDFWLIPFWWRRLIEDNHDFQVLVQERWLALRQDALSSERLFHDIDSLALLLDDAQERNFQLYPILNDYVWPNPYIGGSYEAEVEYLKNWLLARLEWMDTTMGNLALGFYKPSKSYPPQVYPNPAGDLVIFDYYVKHNEVVVLDVYSAAGQLIFAETIPSTFNGANTYYWQPQVPTGVYYYRIQAGGKLLGSGKILLGIK